HETHHAKNLPLLTKRKRDRYHSRSRPTSPRGRSPPTQTPPNHRDLTNQLYPAIFRNVRGRNEKAAALYPSHLRESTRDRKARRRPTSRMCAQWLSFVWCSLFTASHNSAAIAEMSILSVFRER